MKNGVQLIAEERERQISQEGWTPEHDDFHAHGEIACAAACYANHASVTSYLNGQAGHVERSAEPPRYWPWEDEWWKPSNDNPVRDLVKAGALIAAEIDRLQRHESNSELNERPSA